VRFRNGALERKHEERHEIRLDADRVAFSRFRLSTVLAGPLRLSVPNTCPSSIAGRRRRSGSAGNVRTGLALGASAEAGYGDAA
jgi:hypothetical protein